MAVLAELKYPFFFYHHSLDEQPDSGRKHSHAMYEIYFFLSGAGEYYVEGSLVKLQPQALIMLQPAEHHYFHVTGNCPYERCALHFHKDILAPAEQDFLLKAFARTGTGHEPVAFSARHSPGLLEAFRRFDKACVLPIDEQMAMSKAILAEILTLIIGLRRRPVQPAENDGMVTRTLVSDITDYLNDHLASPLNLDQLAAEFFVTKNHLCRTFKRATGTTVLEYLTEKRVLLAKNLLEQGMTPSRVASYCGFLDYSTFYRSFRRLTGQSPNEVQVKHLLL